MFISEYLLDFLDSLDDGLVASVHGGFADLDELLLLLFVLPLPLPLQVGLDLVLLGLLSVLQSLLLFDFLRLGVDRRGVDLLGDVEILEIPVDEFFDFVEQLNDGGIAHFAFRLVRHAQRIQILHLFFEHRVYRRFQHFVLFVLSCVL